MLGAQRARSGVVVLEVGHLGPGAKERKGADDGDKSLSTFSAICYLSHNHDSCGYAYW